MQSFIQTLQEEFRAALKLTEQSTPRRYKFSKAKNIIIVI